VCRDIDPYKLSPSQPDNDKGIEQVKSDGGHNEQIHRCNLRPVIADKSTPTLTRRTTLPGHVLADGRLRDCKSKLEKLAMNPWRTPERVLKAHLPDQCPQFLADRRPTSRGPRLSAPIATKPSTVPPHQCLRPNYQHGLTDRREPAIKLNEEQAVAVLELDATTHLPLQQNQLLPERSIFRSKSALGLEERSQQIEGQEDQRNHHCQRAVIS
jgi:hypothetical protein